MNHYAGIGVSLEASSVCVVDASGENVKEGLYPLRPLVAKEGRLLVA